MLTLSRTKRSVALKKTNSYLSFTASPRPRDEKGGFETNFSRRKFSLLSKILEVLILARSRDISRQSCFRL